MEGQRTYEDSYKYIKELLKENTGGGVVTIEYKKLDSTTAKEIREALNRVLLNRRAATWSIASKCSCE